MIARGEKGEKVRERLLDAEENDVAEKTRKRELTQRPGQRRDPTCDWGVRSLQEKESQSQRHNGTERRNLDEEKEEKRRTSETSMTSNSYTRTSSGRKRPPLAIELEVDVTKTVSSANVRQPILVNDDVLEVPQVDDEGSVVASESVGGVGVTSTPGGDLDAVRGRAGECLGDLRGGRRVEDGVR
jgi:hypothetical protein